MFIFSEVNRGNPINVLIVCAHRPRRSPSQRYRFEQYLGMLENNGFRFTFLPLLTAQEDRLFYSEGHQLRKALILLSTILRRLRHTKLLRTADIVLIQREASFTGSSFFERRAARSAARVIFDFDDSIWLEDTSPGNKKWAWLKRPVKFFENVRLADFVIAGNEYLATRARPFNPETTVIPTTIDTTIHKPMPHLRGKEVVTIGWSGSASTVKHFETLIPVFVRLRNELAGRIKFKLIGANPFYKELADLETAEWSEITEVEQLNTFDIGVMPLPDDEWSRGKCGLKGLSYMACAVPAVMSPVGVNTEIVQHGYNGMLAADQEEWFRALKALAEDPELRLRLGERGRQTVIDRYSVITNAAKYLGVFSEAAARKNKRKK